MTNLLVWSSNFHGQGITILAVSTSLSTPPTQMAQQGEKAGPVYVLDRGNHSTVQLTLHSLQAKEKRRAYGVLRTPDPALRSRSP